MLCTARGRDKSRHDRRFGVVEKYKDSIAMLLSGLVEGSVDLRLACDPTRDQQGVD